MCLCFEYKRKLQVSNIYVRTKRSMCYCSKFVQCLYIMFRIYNVFTFMQSETTGFQIKMFRLFIDLVQYRKHRYSARIILDIRTIAWKLENYFVQIRKELSYNRYVASLRKWDWEHQTDLQPTSYNQERLYIENFNLKVTKILSNLYSSNHSHVTLFIKHFKLEYRTFNMHLRNNTCIFSIIFLDRDQFLRSIIIWLCI